MTTVLFLGVLAVLAQIICAQRSGISTAPVFEDGPSARAPQPFGQRAFRCSDSNGKLSEQWTLTRNLLDNTCTHKIEQFLAGRKADEIVLTGQDCDYEPPCVREAKEIGTFNNGDSGSRTPKRINTNTGGQRVTTGRAKAATGGECSYECKKTGVCQVDFEANGSYSGGTKGSCTSEEFGWSGDCSGTPRFCTDCKHKCRGRWATNFSEIVGSGLPQLDCTEKANRLSNSDGFCNTRCICKLNSQGDDCDCACNQVC